MTDFIEAFFLGLLQGITEFLPVSSSGHLALAGMLFNVKEAGLTLNVLLHAGTLLATAWVLRRRLGQAVMEGFRALAQPALFQTSPGGKDALFVVVASVPTAIIGLFLRDAVEKWTHSPWAVGGGLLVTTALLVSTKFAPQGTGEHPSVRIALIVGVLQGLAVTPGISRSGSTIAALLFLGVQRGRAFELSMLMSLPAVLGAVLLEAPKAFSSGHSLGAAGFGALVAAASGVVALLLLRRVVVGGRFAWFALWTGPVALATLAMARAWPH